MKIEKGVTSAFEKYDVYCSVPITFWGITLPWRRQVIMTGVLEAEEGSGKIVRNVLSPEGYPVFTNGSEEIYIDNSTKLLLLVPSVRESFHASGFRPKTTSTYEQKVRIVNRDPAMTIEVIEKRLEEQHG